MILDNNVTYVDMAYINICVKQDVCCHLSYHEHVIQYYINKIRKYLMKDFKKIQNHIIMISKEELNLCNSNMENDIIRLSYLKN